jgi:two-component system response regulator YesN
MWTVMIADDEPKIRRGLKSSIAELRDDMDVVAEAEDGESALALAAEKKPDILLIDIRMPFLNGLELIERLNEVWSDCVVIVVTGHDEFEYAKKALELRVFEYVLKPVSRNQLAGVLERAGVELGARRKQNRYLGWAREQLERTMPLLQERFMRDLVNGRLSRTETDEQAAFLGVRIAERQSMALIHVVEGFPHSDLPMERDRRLTLLAVQGIIAEVMHDLKLISSFFDENGDIVCLAECSNDAAWGAALGAVESRVAETLSLALVVAQAGVGGGVQGIADTYETLEAEVARKNGNSGIVVQAQNYIDAQYSKPELSLEEVAGAVEISPGYLSRLLKQETGFSFVDYLTRVRINKAVQIMSDPAVKVYEVAEAVGYQSQHYFSRAFKKVFGRPPQSFRRGAGEGANRP